MKSIIVKRYERGKGYVTEEVPIGTIAMIVSDRPYYNVTLKKDDGKQRLGTTSIVKLLAKFDELVKVRDGTAVAKDAIQWNEGDMVKLWHIDTELVISRRIMQAGGLRL